MLSWEAKETPPNATPTKKQAPSKALLRETNGE